MPFYYTEIAPAQKRQDSCQINLGESYAAIAGGWFWATFPAGIGALGMTLMRAALSGVGGGGGTKNQGTWVNGNAIMVGVASASCTRSHHSQGWPDAYWSQWWQYQVAVVEGFAYAYSGQFRFVIPPPPAGATLFSSQVRMWTSGYNNVRADSASPAGAGTFDYDIPFYNNPMPAPSYALTDFDTHEATDGSPYPSGYSSCVVTGSPIVYYAQLELTYIYEPDAPCDTIDATNITDTGGTLGSPDYPHAHWTWGIKGDNTGQDSTDGILTGLTADTWYWYKLKDFCATKTFWFKTKKTDDPTTWSASIITLPATEVWDTGATVHGLFWYKGNARFYVALGFEWGVEALDGTKIHWLYTLGQAAHDWGVNGFKMPIQMTLAGLLPDLTYNYRACLHVHNPDGTLIPMNTNNYFGATLSFGGPVSMFGFGREYVTAKKAGDDISRMAAGRYYMDKEGVFQYESYQRRKAS